MCSAHYDEEPHRCIVAERLQAFKLQATTLQLPLLVLLSSDAPIRRTIAASLG